jgi:hypothetical protein
MFVSLPALASVMLAAACTVTSESTPCPTGSDAGMPVATDGGTTDASTPSLLGFVPTNLASVDLTGPLADIVMQDCGEQIRAGETGRLSCIDPNDPDKPYRFTTLTQADGTKLKVFVVKSLRVPAGVTSQIVAGDDPVAIIALDSIEIEGAVSVGTTATSGGFKAPEGAQNGNGPGGGRVATTGAGDGGGGYCGKGGDGPGAGGGKGGLAYGNAELKPLLAGSSGGGQFGGHGGGALQLVAKNMIRIATGGSINMGGRGSDQGGAGSGGAILLEATEVVVAGKLAANGGGGGAGTGPNDGLDGQLDSTPTAEGTGDANGGSGGKGGAGSSVDGQPGMLNATYPDGDFAGNGGGGAGRIRINTKTGAATITGLVSPALTSACATQGTVEAAR